jgi:1-deoxy-D-xylulose-5-phosphate reductoisomerase
VSGITILGSTGTIGLNTLDVIEHHATHFDVVALTAYRNHESLLEQCRRWRPKYAVLVDGLAAEKLEAAMRAENLTTEVLAGADELEAVARLDEIDSVMAGIVGAAGLLPNLAAARAGKKVMLANKESLVMSGALFIDAVRQNGATLLPIDSEHNAIFQCLPVDFERGLAAVGVRRILLTASGGPFRNKSLDALSEVTPDEACAHPNWVMGRKISVDSATMMNKGLEIIEACWLFGVSQDNVEVVIHPQSVVHSMVEYVDGSVLAQLGNPDMRTPIAYALGWPERCESGVESLNLFDVQRLDFEPPDDRRFPCLRLARQAMRIGGTATAILNAANEEAVAAFLDGRIPFTQIPELIEDTLDRVAPRPAETIEMVLEDDARARSHVGHVIKEIH